MSQILTSLHGKELGLDKDRYLTSPTGIKVPEIWQGASGSEVRLDHTGVTNIDSTATQLLAYGLNLITTTAGTSGIFVLPAPVKGAICQFAISTGCTTVRLNVAATASETIALQPSATYSALTSTAGGSYGRLQGVSTSRWQFEGAGGTIAAT